MRVGHISTFWPNRMGHTHYTDNLIRGMRAHDPSQHVVIAERPSAPSQTDAYRCLPCFRREDEYVDDIAGTVKESGCQVAILQYSNDLFGEDNRFPRLLARLRAEGVSTIVNTHSVYAQGQRTGFRPGRTAADFDRAMAAEAGRIMVHTPRMKSDLVGRGVEGDRVVVIPHGSKAMDAADPVESRARLGIPADRKVVLFFGFIWLGKGVDFLLSVFAKVARRVPDAFLYIGGYTRSNAWAIYMTYLRARMYALGISERTRLWGGYVPDDMVPVVYSAADVVAMPYRQDYSSVSGVVHQTAGIGKLMLCSRIAKFDEVGEIDQALTAPADDLNAWTEGLTRLLTDDAFAGGMRDKIRDFARRTSWDAVGQDHLTVARTLVGTA